MNFKKALVDLLLRMRTDDFLNRVFEGNPKHSARTGRRGHRFQILTYHKVSNEIHPFFPALNPHVFEQQLLFLNKHYCICSMDDLVQGSLAGYVPPRAVAVTLDDGYEDVFTFAFPLLKKYRIPATVFITTGSIGTGQVLWHDRVFDAFRYATVRSAYIDKDSGLFADCTNHETAFTALNKTLDHIRSLPNDQRLEFIDRIEKILLPDNKNESRTPMLSWDQIRRMSIEGIHFGSHTVSHPILSRIPLDDLVYELEDSKKKIEEQLDRTISGFAYPNGRSQDFNQTVKGALRDLGYSYAVTTNPGFNSVGTDPFALRRGQPWQEDPQLFRFCFFLERRGWTI